MIDRKTASIYLAFFIESSGETWVSIRESLPYACSAMKIDPSGKRRSQIAVECAVALHGCGIIPPKNYIVPWTRDALGVHAMFSRATNQSRREEFYASWEWKRLRYDTIAAYGPVCMCCGAKRGDKAIDGRSVVIVVDHIKPISKRWDLRLDPFNTQILCQECNKGKGARDETDFRPRQDAAFARHNG